MNNADKSREELLLELNNLKQENAALKKINDRVLNHHNPLQNEITNSSTHFDSLNDADEQNIRQLFDDYLRMYASRDDLLTTFFSDNFSGFTGGGDFLVKNREEWIAITRQDFAQVKDPIRIDLKDLAVQSLANTIAVATGFFTIHLPIKDHILSREVARLVLIFRKESGGWKISHSSISIPYYLVREGEVYPMQELVDRNQFLEKLIAERTEQLSETNQYLQQVNEKLANEITKHKQVENDLKKSEQKYHLLIDKANEAIVVVQGGLLRLSNPMTVTMTGYSEEEIITMPFQMFIHPDDREIVVDNYQRRLSGEKIPNYYIFRLLNKNGSTRWVHMNAVAIDWEGSPATLNFLTDITELKLTEELLQESSQKWEAIIAASPDGIGMITLDGKIQHISDKLLAMHGFSNDHSEEHKGKSIFDYIDPSCHKLLIENTRKLLAGTNDEKPTEYIALRKDKSPFFIDVKASVLNDSFGNPANILYVERDITERKKAEEALQLSNQKLEAIISASPDGIGMISLDGKLQLMSDKLAEMYGFSSEQKDEILGKSSFDFIDPSNHKVLSENIKKLLAGKSVNKLNEYLAIRKDNSRFYIDVNSTVLCDSGGKPSGILFVERDITERKRVEAEIKLKNEQLMTANAEKDKFFSIIAHDLRSPFQGILGITEVLATESDILSPEEIKKFSSSVNSSMLNLHKLLENLLEWSQLQKGSIGFNPKELSLHEIFSHSIDSIKQRAVQKGITITNDIPLKQRITADEKMINSVLRNLLSNAVKFTNRNGEVIGSSKETQSGIIEISVADTGVGIPVHIIGRLFKLGEKVGMPGTENESSAGLGLLLCKEFVEIHGGKIWVKSEVDKGSTFTFTLKKEGE